MLKAIKKHWNEFQPFGTDDPVQYSITKGGMLLLAVASYLSLL